ncbi:hypothetical protein JCM10512_3722 [Bacteroides reticulotermitis JCM 10512]|uniref:Uncharacterized protein n=1 Tax=Bacteroides reticulotermitis JCM 10512 TaxID=1445607 RepID=W4UVP5_9BACE|nr:hypothetical protein JCM10512_3722 [Bacteroides reticulotermitis JCM 10512]
MASKLTNGQGLNSLSRGADNFSCRHNNCFSSKKLSHTSGKTDNYRILCEWMKRLFEKLVCFV